MTPRETREYEEEIAWHAKAAGAHPTEGPVALDILAIFPIAPSWSKTKRDAAVRGEVPHTSKPDWDNVGKIVSDALNGVAWKDDSQVVEARVFKIYGPEPRLSIRIQSSS